MSLVFNEKSDKQQQKEEDPLKGTAKFTYPWIITVSPPDENNILNFHQKTFSATYQFHSVMCSITLVSNFIHLIIPTGEDTKIWNGSSCFFSYSLYSDNDMKELAYSSERIRIPEEVHGDSFRIRPYPTQLSEALNERTVAKVVIAVELHLPVKHFYRPFDMPTSELNNEERAIPPPADAENSFEFEFLKESDFVIKCPEGSMPAIRIVLNNTSEFMYKHFETSGDVYELVVEHSIDVIEPVVTFLHTCYFQMPKSFDLDYATRLLKAIKFFEAKNEYCIVATIHYAICDKFVKDKCSFDSILQWCMIACLYNFYQLEDMVATVVADKYYFEWQQLFPENARNVDNPLFLDVFGTERTRIFARIDRIYKKSFLTTVILD